ncbi:hypothetical protein AAY86_09240 [Pseudomonas amygdali pv. tabaci str. ATCC 11528]|uniref:Uncharacterized protein n=5 Tax=Pseudomonas syringae group genomosp. 2 TaxID=251698 RepID=A0A0Q0GS94_PSEAJ|nr:MULTISPECIES: hypothetical protein [Pseudomonas syringae group]ARA79191.1 hypothetical protein B5U27_03285 [Pseudomonas amygdali pv. lachrymans]AXH58188.1 hypothetical protein PLA107_025315 [Pseudomonas amygdali pv. lachrymans str. M301315]KEZ28700.1 hypothetical protein A3SK_0103495 [Pseudomonas amygdali pv. tabaci str. 6605]KEZ70338.1 hypothetical protein C1E_0203810 [Pseudomonas amygdali pv. tabaci str. ATCC 11528]KIY15602.1 hypothetical protein RD00_25530 [Pseudomonas amygdali pv. tabac
MKIFVVSHLSPRPASHELICQLSHIQHAYRKTIPVLVIDDRYNLTELPISDLPTDHVQFSLEDFLHENGLSGIVANSVARHMDKVESAWVLIDFGQHDSATCMDFIQKMARYNYLSPRLRNRNIVIMVPAMHLGIYSRTLNASFNNLPSITTAAARSAQIGRLFMVTRLETVLISLPMLAGVLRRMHRLFLRVFRRAARFI